MPSRQKKTGELKLWITTHYSMEDGEPWSVLRSSNRTYPILRVFYAHKEDLEKIIHEIQNRPEKFEFYAISYTNWVKDERSGFHPIHRPTNEGAYLTPPWVEILTWKS